MLLMQFDMKADSQEILRNHSLRHLFIYLFIYLLILHCYNYMTIVFNTKWESLDHTRNFRVLQNHFLASISS